MQKIPTLFERDWQGNPSRVLNVPVPECAWVFEGKGVATRKLDGTPVMLERGGLWKRLEVREGKRLPTSFLATDFVPETGKHVGWVPVTDGPEDRWYREAFEGQYAPVFLIEAENTGKLVQFAPTGGRSPEELAAPSTVLWESLLGGNSFLGLTCELVGPKVQGNPERYEKHTLVPHGMIRLEDVPRDFDGLGHYLASNDIEGVVWHEAEEGRMAKIKARDFGIRRGG